MKNYLVSFQIAIMFYCSLFDFTNLIAQTVTKSSKQISKTAISSTTHHNTAFVNQSAAPTKYTLRSNPDANTHRSFSSTPESKEYSKRQQKTTANESLSSKSAVTSSGSSAMITLNKEHFYQNFWKKYNVRHGRSAARANRHCGCAGDIEYINNTKDTLDFYFKYLSVLETPTLEGAVLPPLAIKNTYPSFSLAPGDSTSLRGYCRGGLQYEVTTRKNRFTGQGHDREDVHINSFVRLSCMSKTLIISEDME